MLAPRAESRHLRKFRSGPCTSSRGPVLGPCYLREPPLHDCLGYPPPCRGGSVFRF